MSSGSRPPSPAAAPALSVNEGSCLSESAPALAPRHEVAAVLLTGTVPAGANPSPSLVHPTMPSKGTVSSNRDHDHTLHTHAEELSADADPHLDRGLIRTPSSSLSAMSKAGLKTGALEVDEPDSQSVIDISGPARDDPSDERHREAEGEEEEEEEEDEDEDGEEEEEDGEEEVVGMDTELTIHVDGEEAMPRDSDVTETDVDARAHTDAGSTLYGSLAAAGEQVHEHPLRLDVHPPSRHRGKGDDDEDEGEVDDLGLSGGRGGRESPQRFVLTGGKAGGVQLHEFGSKPSNGQPRIPHSAYYFGPPPPDSAYGTEPVGQIGVHHPREIVRVERDYSGGELPQFAPTYPLELEGRITPTQFLETINAINELLISAHSLGHAFVDNALAYFTLQISRAVKKTHYEKEMDRLKVLVDELNIQMYNPVGLHIKWPRGVALLFLEIEYYVSSDHRLPRKVNHDALFPSDTCSPFARPCNLQSRYLRD